MKSLKNNFLCTDTDFWTLCILDMDDVENVDSMLNIKYGISGDRTTGAHSPVPVQPGDSEELLFKIALRLKRPVLDPCLAVGFLPFSTDCLRVGQLVNMRWRVERLKTPEDASISGVSLQNILRSTLHFCCTTCPIMSIILSQRAIVLCS